MNSLLDKKGDIKFSDKRVESTIVFTGDLCPVFRLEDYLLKGDFANVFGDTLEVLQSSDLNIVNLETVLCENVEPIEKLGPCLKVNPKIAEQLKKIPIHVACLANNHMLDFNEGGLNQTTQALKNAKISFVGAGISIEEAEAPLFVTTNNIKICILNFVLAGAPINFEKAHTAMLEPRKNCIAIKKSKAEGYLVVPVIHTGKEQVLLPAPSLRDTCKDFIDAGASAVICHHPHVPQGFEIYENKPIVYSLGNFLFDWNIAEPETDSSYFISLGLDNSSVINLKVHPFAKIKEFGGIGLLKNQDFEEYIDLLNQISEPLADSKMYDNLWKEQCRILYEKFYCSKIERATILSNPLDPKYKMAASTFHNFFAHKTHSDVLCQIMKMITCNEMASVITSKDWLLSKMEALKKFSINQKGSNL